MNDTSQELRAYHNLHCPLPWCPFKVFNRKCPKMKFQGWWDWNEIPGWEALILYLSLRASTLIFAPCSETGKLHMLVNICYQQSQHNKQKFTFNSEKRLISVNMGVTFCKVKKLHRESRKEVLYPRFILELAEKSEILSKRKCMLWSSAYIIQN